MNEPASPDAPQSEPLQSVHTNTLPMVLDQFGLTILISTYQAGKLIFVRSDEGRANTHFRSFQVPMGLALTSNRLAVGTRYQVWEFQEQPAVAKRLEPPGKHDTCYMPRQVHYTGHMAIHEMAYADDGQLWIVNTRFSCLCTLNPEYSFVPRWQPPFVTALAPEDRCHLNGMALVDGAPRYVTALGTQDTPGGWRETKARGGVLMEVPSGKIILSGLSMPHSPRWYDGRLWVLESGAGSLSYLDPATGRLQHVALLPGFTRGLDFYGNLAFIGLSQVRESAVFSGIPITDRLPVQERMCGMWVVDIRNGQVVAFLRFDSGVQEVFAVTILANRRFPELLNEEPNDLIAESFVLPDEALALVPKHD